MSADLRRHFQAHGLGHGQFWIGPEHPKLEEVALDMLVGRPSPSVLEIGFQSGGFAVPVILALHHCRGFRYVGIDSLEYPNATPPQLIASFLHQRGVRDDAFELRVGDAAAVLSRLRGQFDVVLVDHLKPLYPRELRTLLARRLVAPGGIILMHDVLDRAEGPWRRCALICRLFRCACDIRDDVPGGVAVVRPRALSIAQTVAARAAAEPLRALETARRVVRRLLR